MNPPVSPPDGSLVDAPCIRDAAHGGDERTLSFNQSSDLTLEWLAQIRSKPRRPFPLVVGLGLEGVPNIEAIEDALNAVVRRHEVLRATFLDPRRLSPAQEAALTSGLLRHGIADAGVFWQRVRPSASLRLSVESVPAAEPFAIVPAGVQARIHDDVARPFDYASPPLMRAALYLLDPTHQILVVTLHHLAADAWSLGVLRAELIRLYDCRVSGRSFDEVAPLPLQYGDFARRQRQEFGEIPETLVSYCKAQWTAYGHAQVGPGDLPPGRGSPVPCVPVPGCQTVTIDAARAQDLRNLAKRHRVTTYMLGLTAMAILFHAYTRRTALAWWGYCSNRTSTELESLIGWIAHGRLFGVTLTPAEPVTELLARVRAHVYDMYDHEHVPVQVFWKILRDQRLAAPEAFGQAYLSFDAFVQQRDDRVMLADGTVMRAVPRGLLKSGNWPSLGVWSIENRTGWSIDCRYSSTGCDASAIASFLDDFTRVLDAMARTPGAAVSELASLATRR
jgi:hypothetical protein